MAESKERKKERTNIDPQVKITSENGNAVSIISGVDFLKE